MNTFYFFLIFYFLSVVFGHRANFNIVITDSTGANLTSDIIGIANPQSPTTVYFTLYPKPNGPKVTFEDLMLMHARYIHVLLVSFDYNVAFHVHPDDFGDLQTMSDTGAFYVNVNFTASGQWMISASFGYQQNGDMNNPMIEGFAQGEITIGGNIPQMTSTNWNYATSGRFKTYPLTPGSDLFDGPLVVSTNSDPNGVYVELLMPEMGMMGNIIANRAENVNISLGQCNIFLINVYTDETKTTPVTLVPYLEAPVHLTIASPDDAAYHAHGIYLISNPETWAKTMLDIMNEMSETTMETLMDNMLTDPNVNVTMNAMMMLGLEMNMTLDCQVDMGSVMMSMGMTNMNTYYGPPQFGPSLACDFDWPQDSQSWRLWAYMKIKNPNGTESLLVPNFDVFVAPIPFSSMSMTTGMSVATSVTVPIVFIISLLIFLLV